MRGSAPRAPEVTGRARGARGLYTHPMTALVIQNDPVAPLGLLSRFLDSPRVLRAWEDPGAIAPLVERVRAEGAPFDSLVVLGGTADAHADGKWPWLPDLRALIAACAGAGVRVLGVCLGAQLAAVALGGRVDVGAPLGPECGVTPISWTGDALSHEDPLIRCLTRTRVVFEDHGDAIGEAPRGSQVLAVSEKYPQAFLAGSVLGVQFHPEITEPIARQWQESNEDTDTERVIAGYLAHEAELASTCEALAQWVARAPVRPGGDGPVAPLD